MRCLHQTQELPARRLSSRYLPSPIGEAALDPAADDARAAPPIFHGAPPITLHETNIGQGVKRQGNVGMLGPQHLFADAEIAPKKQLRFTIAALVLIQQR